MSCPSERFLIGFGSLLLVAAGCACEETHAAVPPEPIASDTSAPPTEEPLAVLVEVHGDVRWQRAGTASWRRDAADQGLLADDSVQVMEDGYAVVRFRDGATVRLDAGTTLRIPDQPREVARLRHLSGRLVARLASSDGAERMEVELPPGTLVLDAPSGGDGQEGLVEARVDVADARTEIAMLRGVGRLERPEQEAVNIGEDHYVALADDGQLVEEGRNGEPVVLVGPVGNAAIRTRQQIVFSWEALDDVAEYQLELDPGGDAPPVISTVADTSTSLEVASGDYTWSVRGLKEEQPMPRGETRALAVTLDRAPPRLTVRSPTPGQVVRGGAVLIAGVTEPGATLEIDGRPAVVSEDGHFEVRHPLPRGLANVVVRATDDLGNARLVSRSVLRQ